MEFLFYLSGSILPLPGTAYRIAYKNPRFSEDLDFSVSGTKIEDIENILMSVLEDLSNNGIVCEIEEAKKTTGGYLAKLYTTLQGEKIPISLQISLRQKMENGHDSVDIINEYIPTYTALILPKDIMIDEKINAAITRSKPRDFYDIYFLLRNGFLTATQKDQLKQVKHILSIKTIKFADELSYFLPKSMKTIADRFPKPLLIELDKYF